MGHAVLLGDSIFDNASYVTGPSVIDHLQESLPADWAATLLAVDGSITDDLLAQVKNLPESATHLVVSAGGNNALQASSILLESISSLAEAMVVYGKTLEQFRSSYQHMLAEILAAKKPTAVCTIYDAIPDLGHAEKAALAGFNETILRQAFLAKLPVIDLRLICTKATDFSEVSPIEPSIQGGAKIAKVIAELVTQHDFSQPRSVIYS